MSKPNLTNWIKDSILKQPVYSVNIPDHEFKLNQNESPYDWPVEIKQAITTRLIKSSWNRYPEQNTGTLKRKLAGLNAVDADQLLLGNGSNEILQAISSVTIIPGDKIVAFSPSFAMYKLLAERYGGELVVSHLDVNFQPEMDDLRKKATDAKLVFIANPNSPTGTLLTIEQLASIAATTSGILIVDEAYFEFANAASAVDLLPVYPNIVVTRTFSKAFGLAAYRFGYGIMSAQLAHEIGKGLMPFNIDIPTSIAVETILVHYPKVLEQAQAISAARDDLISAINNIDGFKAFPSRANFFLMKGPISSNKLFKLILTKGVLTRNVSSYSGCEELIRISIGTTEENDRLLFALKGAV